MASSSHGVAIMPARTTSGPRMRAKAAMRREKRRGEVSMERKLRADFVIGRRPPGDSHPPRGGRRDHPPGGRNARRLAGTLRTVRLNRAQMIDIAIALPILVLGVLEALDRDNTAAGWSPRRSTAPRSRCAAARRSAR